MLRVSGKACDIESCDTLVVNRQLTVGKDGRVGNSAVNQEARYETQQNQGVAQS